MTTSRAALLVLLAVVATACQARLVPSAQHSSVPSPSAPPPSPGASSPSVGRGAPPTLVGSPPAATGNGGPGPVLSPAVNTSANNLVTLSGSARSVQTSGSVSAGSIHLTGAPVLTVSADVVDGAGHDHGQGTLTAAGPDLVLTGQSLTLGGSIIYQPATANVAGAGVGLASPTTMTAVRFSFQPATPAATSGQPTPSAPAAISLTGPVTVRSPVNAALTGAPVTWADAPQSLQVTSPEADLSWAGTGSITTASGPVTAGYLGVRAQQLSVSLARSNGQVQIQGTGLALGVYANGVPQIKVQARVDVLSTDAVTGFLGLKNAFTWTPRNLDSTYDMAILSVHPGNTAARNVHLGLLAMPPMFGGEPHAAVGGDTSGLKGGEAIDSLIARNGDDKRSIGFDGSAGITIVLIVQGNFDPITVTIHTT